MKNANKLFFYRNKPINIFGYLNAEKVEFITKKVYYLFRERYFL